MPRLEHRPALDGAFTHKGETYQIDDGIIEVDDSDVAREMAEHRRLELIDVDETPTLDGEETTEDGGICGTEMTDGSICQRPAGSCPYHD